jgi:subtilisin
MRCRGLPLALALLLLLPAMSAQAASPAGGGVDGGKADPAGRYIVVLKKSATVKGVRDRHAKREGLRADRSFSKVFRGFAGKMSAEQVQALRSDPDVAAVVPDELVEAAGQLTPTGVLRIGGRASSAARIDGVDARVDADVAVVDTGIDGNHPDLNVAGGYNCTSADRTAWRDDNHHGTHVAGTIGALDNGYGVVGVAPGVRLWAVRILDATGYGLLSWYVCGLDWIATQRDPNDPSRPLIEAVNMSVTKWGSDDNNCGFTNNDILHQAICRVVAAGIPVIAAAANDHANAASRVPASYNEVITVSALADTDGKAGGLGGNRCYSWGGYDVDDTFADFSNYGADVDIMAPGKCIWSTLPGNSFGYSSGTSMAAPAVTGAVALYRATRPWTKPADAKAALQYLGNLNWATSTDPDTLHEKLLDVSRLGPAGDYNVSVGSGNPFGEIGGTVTLPVTLARTATHFERVSLSATAEGPLTATLSLNSLMGFTANSTSVKVVVPPSTPAGHYNVTITGTEGPHVHSATTTIVVENDPPSMPAPSLNVNAARAATLPTQASLVLTWPAATDASSRIAAYQYETSIDGSAWGNTRTFSAIARTYRPWAVLGHRYQFRLRAMDAAGNWSDWQPTPTINVARIEDAARGIRYSSGWSTFPSSSASGGRYHWTDRAGATLTFSSTGRYLALVGRLSKSGGDAAVYVNGVYQGRFSAYGASTYQKVVWGKDFGSSGVRTVTVRALGTRGHPRVYLDAVLTGR